jgi:hypothetical protein
VDIRNAIASVAFAGLALAAPGVAQSQSSPTTPYPQAPVVADSSMRLQVKPRDTVVFVDGYYAGVADDFDGTFQRLHIDAGQHRIQLFLPGHRLYAQDLYLQPGNTFTMRHTMEPLAPGEPEPERPTGSPQAPRLPPGPPSPPRDPATSRSPSTSSFGTLAVHVQPDEGLVIIDGERWNGSGDAIEVRLAPGAHTVEVRKAGFRGYLTEVTVRGGEVTRLNIALSHESAK